MAQETQETIGKTWEPLGYNMEYDQHNLRDDGICFEQTCWDYILGYNHLVTTNKHGDLTTMMPIQMVKLNRNWNWDMVVMRSSCEKYKEFSNPLTVRHSMRVGGFKHDWIIFHVIKKGCHPNPIDSIDSIIFFKMGTSRTTNQIYYYILFIRSGINHITNHYSSLLIMVI